MSYATINRIRAILRTEGVWPAVAAFRQVYPLGGPEDFMLFIHGKI